MVVLFLKVKLKGCKTILKIKQLLITKRNIFRPEDTAKRVNGDLISDNKDELYNRAVDIIVKQQKFQLVYPTISSDRI